MSPAAGGRPEVSTRARVIGRVADHLAGLHDRNAPADPDHPAPSHPLRVAVDGVTAAGKTTLAGELAAALAERGRPVIRLSMDGFHHPRAHRYRRGRDSAAGYYEDAYDSEAFADAVLRPLGPDGDQQYVERVHDLATDELVKDEPKPAPPDAILLVDGTFLQRPGLAGLWDQVIYLDTSYERARARGARRDAEMFGGVEQAVQAFERRYHAACRIYAEEVDPAFYADIVIGNDDPEQPVLRRIGGTGGASVRLFSYGTLQHEGVQRSSFGRLLAGEPDTLPGFWIDWISITDPDVIAASGSDRHPMVRRLTDGADLGEEEAAGVPGTVFLLTGTELAAADAYEVEEYRRVRVRLGSGTLAWVYLGDDDLRDAP